MSPNTSTNPPRSVRRRPSLLAGFRPKTATAGADPPVPPLPPLPPLPSRPHTGVWVPHKDGSYREAVSPFSHEIAVCDSGTGQSQPQQPGYIATPTLVESEDDNTFPSLRTRHRASKSFSNLRHGVTHELRAVARRLSLTLRHKSSKYNLAVPMGGKDDGNTSDDYRSADSGAVMGSRPGRSFHRPSYSSLNALNRYGSPPPPVPYVADPIPGNGSEPPILPDDLSRGAAARAAAAAQNEMVKIGRVTSGGDSKIFDSETVLFEESEVSGDSESGIDVNLQNNVDVSEDDSEVVRKNPMDYLPAELMAHVFSFLDADSLRQTELVSHQWNELASSHHVWREAFWHEYKRRSNTGKIANGQPKYMGLGRVRPNQDWKKMFAVRRALESRWKEGKAAAIYLHGHKDSVYCVQFDENKIITGSRDRTIRVWDAHYPWPCLKIIGAPPDPKSPSTLGRLVIEPPDDDDAARIPFISICPPARSSPDLFVPTSATDDYHRASILCLQFDDEILVTGSRTGDLVKRLLGHRGPVNSAQLRGELIVSASGDGVAKLWNITSGLCIKEFPSRNRGLACVEFSEDARTILAGGNDEVIYQFDANTGELVDELKGHWGLVRSLHMDSANGRIISGSYDRSVKVYDAATGELSISLANWTTSWILGAKSDYRRIVAAGQDGRTVIMDFGYGLDGIELLEE
ncbi:hypothetical protein EMPG_09929 [Blastomyces silverae]|uniref:Probable E3 ubiquitin ligase complex SCF subunit sconB n=1 Tax=Blastomyces silverae TaxID=2060906 RepID=A0A0H1BFH3_9EURO|nr:hypothetical protein EMPG_09929 [Blastomyces silverae]